jgi:DNA-binding NarL/FixJ family response regulator
MPMLHPDSVLWEYAGMKTGIATAQESSGLAQPAECLEQPIEDVAGRTSQIRVLLVDRHQLFAQSLAIVLAGDSDIVVVGAENDLDVALARARWTQPDVALVSYHLLEERGPWSFAALRSAVPEIKLVILTARSDDETLATCLQAGAVGYVQRESPPDEALRAIKQVYAGKLQLTPTASPILPAPPTHDLRPPANHLAPRELELLEALASGLTLDEAARQMGISINTVRTYVKHVMRKLGARTTLHALISAMRSGWINLPEQLPRYAGTRRPPTDRAPATRPGR